MKTFKRSGWVGENLQYWIAFIVGQPPDEKMDSVLALSCVMSSFQCQIPDLNFSWTTVWTQTSGEQLIAR